MINKTFAVFVVTAGCSLSGLAHADGLDTLQYAFSGGTPNVDLRVRYEDVKLDPLYGAGVTHDAADALTARIRLGYTTGKWNNIDIQAELEDVANLGGDKFQSTRNQRVAYPTIADPDGGELNQAWIRYSGLPKTTLKIGRQRLIYDNARFIGNVGWRQNEQTYDGATFTSSYFDKTTINLAYLTNVNSFRSFAVAGGGPGAGACSASGPACTDNLDIKARLVNIAITPLSKPTLLTVTPYLYQLDFAFNSNARRDTQTLGLRATGALPYQAVKFLYTAEYAKQSEFADKPAPVAPATSVPKVDAQYVLLEAGLSYGGITGKLGYETLGSNDAGTLAFQTPLATAHAHDGWADLFVVTPPTGLKRLYAQGTYTWKKLALTGVYHQFSATSGGSDYGTEIDAQAVYSFTDQFAIGAKLARYSGDSKAPTATLQADTDKTFAWIEYKF